MLHCAAGAQGPQQAAKVLRLAAFRIDLVSPILGKQQCCAGQDDRCLDLGGSIKEASLFDTSPVGMGRDLPWCQVAAGLGLADKAQVLECIHIT